MSEETRTKSVQELLSDENLSTEERARIEKAVARSRGVVSNLPEKAWYVLRAISGKEASVKEILDGAIKNTDLGQYLFQVLIPMEKVLQVRNGKKVVKERNLYGGYVFVEAILTPEVENHLRNTTNVIDFLKGKDKGSKPEPLRLAEVQRMLGVADSFNNIDEEEIEYRVGDTVKVNYGPFSGFVGTIQEVNQEKKKLVVMVKIFGRQTPLELEHSQVELELS